MHTEHVKFISYAHSIIISYCTILMFIQMECQQELLERKCMSMHLPYWQNLVHRLNCYMKGTLVLKVQITRVEKWNWT
jgi:hypothetical protein